MRTKLTLDFIFIPILFLFPRLGFSNPLCPEKLIAFENLQLQQSLSQNGDRCYLGLHPRDAFETLRYRDFLLTSDGLLMVFNSFGPNPGPHSEGAREFYFFPREFKGFNWSLKESSLIVHGFQDRVLKFSLKTGQIESLSGAELQLSNDVSELNAGGLEIFMQNGVLLDAGFLFKNAPTSLPTRFSSWKNEKGQECRLKNSVLFEYQGEDVTLKSKKEIFKVLSRDCPDFILSERE